MFTVDVVDGAGADRYRQAVQDAYVDVFGPQDEGRWRDEVWERHRARPDFRLARVVDGSRLVGFAWGYTGEPGQYWTDLMATALGAAGQGWIGGHFEFVELAVGAEWRGRGLGGRLHDALLHGLPHETAVLCTSADATNLALPLYRARGWTTLGRLNEDVQIMGLRHPGNAVDVSG